MPTTLIATELRPQCDTKKEGKEKNDLTETTLNKKTKARPRPLHLEHTDYLEDAYFDLQMGWPKITGCFNQTFHCNPPRRTDVLRNKLTSEIDIKAASSNPSAFGIARRCPERALSYHWVDDQTKAKAQRLSTYSS